VIEMLGWLREQAGKIFYREREGRTARSIDRCLSELAQLRQVLDGELAERTWSVNKIVIEKLQTDKVELNLGSLDIGELSGMLSIGFNYGGRLIRTESKGSSKTGQQPLPGKSDKKNPDAPPTKTTTGKDGAQNTDSCKPGTTGKPKEAQPEEPARASVRPRLNIRYRR
jgi:hypothetical protein